jgi:hypothetical protein
MWRDLAIINLSGSIWTVRLNEHAQGSVERTGLEKSSKCHYSFRKSGREGGGENGWRPTDLAADHRLNFSKAIKTGVHRETLLIPARDCLPVTTETLRILSSKSHREEKSADLQLVSNLISDSNADEIYLINTETNW